MTHKFDAQEQAGLRAKLACMFCHRLSLLAGRTHRSTVDVQYCDRGSMEKACEQNRFMNKLDGKPDMVRTPCMLMSCSASTCTVAP